MKPIHGYHLIKPDDLSWRPSNLMKIPNADFLERTGSENLGARLWRLPPRSANTLHKHIRQEEFYFVLEGTGRLRVGDETLTVPRYGGVLVGPDPLRQVFNDTDAEVLWLIIGAPEELELLPSAPTKPDLCRRGVAAEEMRPPQARCHRFGSNSSTIFPEGSRIQICEPPGPLTMSSRRNFTPAARSRAVSALMSETGN